MILSIHSSFYPVVRTLLKILPTIFLVVTGFLAATWTSASLGQNTNNAEAVEQDTQAWWQIEVIIFAQGTNSALSSEVWPTGVELAYPDQWQELPPLADPDTGDEPTSDNANDPDNSKTIYLLPKDEWQLQSISASLVRNRQRRILFHQAWRQAMEQYQDEEPVLINGGDQFDDHFELEGSVKIYWQRLLHVDTNLWLSEFSINTGQERLDWPELPRRPNQLLPTPSLAEFDQPSDTRGTQNFQNGNFGNPNSNAQIGQLNTSDWLGQHGNTTFYDPRYDEILSRSYIVNNLALMKQERPMRSKELHYLDHPLLGILVKITRHEELEPEENETDEDVEPAQDLTAPSP